MPDVWSQTTRERPMQRRDLNAPDAPLPVAAYTQAIEVSGATRTLYISGQVGQRVDGTIPDDIVEQSRLAWQNLEAQLKAADERGPSNDQATAMASTSIFHAGLASPPTMRVLAGLRSPSTLLRPSRAAARSPWYGRMVVILMRLSKTRDDWRATGTWKNCLLFSPFFA